MWKFGNDRKMLKQRNPINWGWGEAFYPPTGYLYTPEGWYNISGIYFGTNTYQVSMMAGSFM